MDLTKQALYNIFILINYSLTTFYIAIVHNSLDRDTVNISAVALTGHCKIVCFSLYGQMCFSDINAIFQIRLTFFGKKECKKHMSCK